MFYSSKTEALHQQNFNPNNFFEQPTLTQGYITNDLALSKAISIIQELKDNLSYALKVNELLTQQNQLLKSNAERTTKKVNADTTAWQKRLKEIQSEKQEIIQLLEETKATLLLTEQQYQQTKREVEKCQRIIYEQKKAYEELQQNYMNQSLNYAGQTSINLNKSDLHYISEIEKENHELQLQLKRLNQQAQKNQVKTLKLEKENTEFRKWMASVLGLQKVVEGSEKILMKQISQRVQPA